MNMGGVWIGNKGYVDIWRGAKLLCAACHFGWTTEDSPSTVLEKLFRDIREVGFLGIDVRGN